MDLIYTVPFSKLLTCLHNMINTINNQSCESISHLTYLYTDFKSNNCSYVYIHKILTASNTLLTIRL